jgi:RNA polymerase sigma-70 factor, ECF subfamily
LNADVGSVATIMEQEVRRASASKRALSGLVRPVRHSPDRWGIAIALWVGATVHDNLGHAEEPMDMTKAVEAEIPCLQRYAHKLMRNHAAAEELVQECVVRGLSKQHLWREDTNLRAWLCTILHNQYVNEIRRVVREGTIVELCDADEELALPPAQDKVLELRDVRRALATLTDGQRDAVILIGLDGWSYERVAKAAGVPVGTIRSRLSRGRDRIKLAA